MDRGVVRGAFEARSADAACVEAESGCPDPGAGVVREAVDRLVPRDAPGGAGVAPWVERCVFLDVEGGVASEVEPGATIATDSVGDDFGVVDGVGTGLVARGTAVVLTLPLPLVTVAGVVPAAADAPSPSSVLGSRSRRVVAVPGPAAADAPSPSSVLGSPAVASLAVPGPMASVGPLQPVSPATSAPPAAGATALPRPKA